MYTIVQRLYAYWFLVFCSVVHAQGYDWAVIGAGPAGIVTVGILLDLGVDPRTIAWVDPEFMVGRLGQYYTTVPGNTKTKLFIDFINACRTFVASGSPAIERLKEYDLEKECSLRVIVDPLLDITAYLRTLVDSYQQCLKALTCSEGKWHASLARGELEAQHVVLALGAHPKSLHYTEPDRELSLDIALQKQCLSHYVSPSDTIAVVGSAHSAVLVMKFLSELPAGRIINLYTKSLQYAVDLGSWTLNASLGLKGIAAEWARTVLEKQPPANLIRLLNTPEARAAWLPICTKIIYAAGYERNELPSINNESIAISYDETSGVIAPRLFGIGIAFPELHTDTLGNSEYRIGLNSFMEYARRVVPHWIAYKKDFAKFVDLFDIMVL